MGQLHPVLEAVNWHNHTASWKELSYKMHHLQPAISHGTCTSQECWSLWTIYHGGTCHPGELPSRNMAQQIQIQMSSLANMFATHNLPFYHCLILKWPEFRKHHVGKTSHFGTWHSQWPDHQYSVFESYSGPVTIMYNIKCLHIEYSYDGCVHMCYTSMSIMLPTLLVLLISH